VIKISPDLLEFKSLTINGRKDIYPSWFKKPKELPGKQFTVDKVSKKLATDCTPESAREVITATGTDAGEGVTEYYSNDYDLKIKMISILVMILSQQQAYLPLIA
jgi:hypothetical protein